MLGKLLKSVFGGGRAAETASDEPAATLEYKNMSIEATPITEGSQFRTAGYISGEHGGEVHRVRFIRADTSGDRRSAIDHSLAKGKQIIDEQGPALLLRSHL